MQEFSSVTASSYDADSLAPLLTEKSAEGWSVVSIVSAGTNIVAYLERESDGSPATAEAADTSTPSTDASTAADPTPYVPAAAAADVTAPAVESPAVEEPAGWAAAPDEPTAQPAESTNVDSLAGLVAGVDAAEEPARAETPAEPVAEQPAAATAPAPESTVPAGWYADPSGRFELRYWDGTAWTEHVSRAGQQFTDPPVA